MDMKTPGVYIVEKNAFPNSIVPVPTAVPAFIGHTQKALDGHKSLFEKPFKISSLLEYEQYFGKPQVLVDNYRLMDVDEVPEVDKIKQEWFNATTEVEKNEKLEKLNAARALYTDFTANNVYLRFFPSLGPYTLYYHIVLFFANGGSSCYIVSVGTHGEAFSYKKFENGINVLMQEQEPTILVIPEASNLASIEEYSKLTNTMLEHCGKVMKNRISILDIYNGYENINKGVIDAFRDTTVSSFLNYGTAYYPWMNTTLVDTEKVNKMQFSYEKNIYKQLLHLLTTEDVYKNKDDADGHILRCFELEYICNLIDKNKLFQTEDAKTKEKTKYWLSIGKIDQDTLNAAKEETGSTEDEKIIKAAIKVLVTKNITEAQQKNLIQKLLDKSIHLKNCKIIFQNKLRHLSYLPPSAAIAGIYAQNDNMRGVWKAPANISISGIVGPSVHISDKEQEDLNVPNDGKAINAIRFFPGEGTKVWGARTLDGKSNDWRYINVRRTMIFLEQSIKSAARAYVFEPNDANTWVKMRASIYNFLHNVWRQGGLVGASPKDAYSVHIGLGESMTPQDILDGIIRVVVLVAVSRPSEFVEITFQQQMQKN